MGGDRNNMRDKIQKYWAPLHTGLADYFLESNGTYTLRAYDIFNQKMVYRNVTVEEFRVIWNQSREIAENRTEPL